MKCSRCNKNEATVMYRQIINGNETKMALCSQCAAELEGENKNSMFMNPFNSIFGSMFSPTISFGAPRRKETQRNYSRLTQKAQNTLSAALSEAQNFGHSFIGSEHILLGLLESDDGIASKAILSRGLTVEKTKEEIQTERGSGNPTTLNFNALTPMAKKIIDEAGYTAAKMGHSYIGTEHILCAILIEEDSIANKILRKCGISTSDISNDLSEFFSRSVTSQQQETLVGNSCSQISNCPTLSKYGVNLVEKAKLGKIDPIIGRDSETERVIQILSRRTKNNPCLIGEPGVGKTAVVEGLAQKIADGDVPDNLKEKIIVTLDISGMVAGAKYRGEFEERMKGIMDEVANNPNIVLFVDEIHTIIGAGGADGAVDAANILKPALARGAMQLIGATTINEYRKYIEKDAAFERRFQSVMVGEPTPDEALQILYGLRDKYEAHHNLKISDDALNAAVSLSVRYIGDRFLPDKAIDLVDEAASKIRIKGFTPSQKVKDLEEKIKSISKEKEEAVISEDYERAANLRNDEKQLKEELDSEKKNSPSREDIMVTSSDIEDVVTSWTGIPVKKLASEESERLLHLEEILKERVIGQDEAVSAVARAIRRGRTGLKDPKRPVGSFIFLGPTGVGKTELTKALADVMFGDENAMIRIDMSEYMEKHSVSKLIGSPPGYVGYDEGGQLTEKVRHHPYSVVLFDEIEKAHPDVFNILLQILDDGILTDAMGRRVDFKNTIIIMTSNVGQGSIVTPKHLGFGDIVNNDNEMKTDGKAALKETFRPEFLNRIDETIVFNKLSDEDIIKITTLMLEGIKARILDKNIELSFDKEVIALLAKEGFDPVYGARPLRRAIMRKIEDSFSEALLRGDISSGDKIKAILNNNEINYIKD